MLPKTSLTRWVKILLILTASLAAEPCFSFHKWNKISEDSSLYEPYYMGPVLSMTDGSSHVPATLTGSFLCLEDNMNKLMDVILPDEAILSYSVRDSLMQIVVVTRDGIWIRHHSQAEQLLHTSSRFLRSIKRINNDEFYREGKILYNLLVGPVNEYLRGKRRLIIIGGGKISEIPFEALITEDADSLTADQSRCEIPFLVCRYEILYSSSVSCWYNSVRDPGNNPEENSFLGIAPVSFRDDEGREISRLPYSENEILEIEDLFKSFQHPALSCLFEEATTTRLYNELPGKTHIHIATHTFFDKEEPGRNGLVLSDSFSPEQNYRNEILHYEDILRFSINARLVVLNACSTGRIFDAATGSAATLSGAFIRAGARNVVYSLWNVTDKYGNAFMKRFYKKILEGKQYSASLRETKLDFIADRETSLPYLWAGFIMEGE